MVKAKYTHGVVMRCSKCNGVFGEAVAGSVWIVRADRPRNKRGDQGPGPIKLDMEYWPAIDGHPHRFVCRCGAVWHLRELPTGRAGTEHLLR
jgi:hypothetical protein